MTKNCEPAAPEGAFCRLGHRDVAELVAVRARQRPDDLVAGPARAVARRIAALEHEVRDDAVERETVEEVLRGQERDRVRDRAAELAVEDDADRPAVRASSRSRSACPWRARSRASCSSAWTCRPRRASWRCSRRRSRPVPGATAIAAATRAPMRNGKTESHRLRMPRQARPTAPAPVQLGFEDVSDDDRSGYLLFVPSPQGYRLEERDGSRARARRARRNRRRRVPRLARRRLATAARPAALRLPALVLNRLVDCVTNLIGDHGVPAVFFLMVLESACLPVPSEVIMLFAGYLVSIDQMSLTAGGHRRRGRQHRRLLDRLGRRHDRRARAARAPRPLRAHHARAARHGRSLVRAPRRAHRADRPLPADHPHVHLAARRHRAHAVLALHALHRHRLRALGAGADADRRAGRRPSGTSGTSASSSSTTSSSPASSPASCYLVVRRRRGTAHA